MPRITDYPAAGALDGTEQFYLVQGESDANLTLSALAAFLGVAPVIPWKTYRLLDAQPPGVLVKGSAGLVGGLTLGNCNNSQNMFVKLYDKASIPLSSDTPVATFSCNPGQQLAVAIPGGIQFANGIGIRVTGLYADNDATGAAAGSYQVNLFWQ